jgi:hypothetical protein
MQLQRTCGFPFNDLVVVREDINNADRFSGPIRSG